MAVQRYAAVSLPSSDGAQVRLPMSSAMARRLCFWMLDRPESETSAGEISTPNGSIGDRLETSAWLLHDPSVLLWAARHRKNGAQTAEQLQAWLPTVLPDLFTDVLACELDSDLVRRHCRRFLGGQTTDSEAANGDSRVVPIDDFLTQIRPWVTLGEAGSESASLNGSAQFTVDWSPAWDVDSNWHDMLLAQLNHDQAANHRGYSDAEFDERLEQEKLLAMKQLAYGASHEINNPLANIATRAQTLLIDESDPQRRRTLATINQQAFRAHEMIADMMLFAMPPSMELSEVSLPDLVAEAVSTVRELADENSVSVESNAGTDLWVTADQTQLLVAVRCLLQNAIEAMPDGGALSIRLGNCENAGNSQKADQSEAGSDDCQHGAESMAELIIEDEGPGLSDEVRRHLFDPFFSGREAGRGLGFGLSKAWRIVTELGGQIVVGAPDHSKPAGDADDASGSGATFTVRLPLSRTGQACG